VRRPIQLLIVVIATIAAMLLALIAYVRVTGLVARSDPSQGEARVARAVRAWAIPREARERRNPIPATPDVLVEARAHYSDHCAVCHGNDGRGQTEMGQGLWPKTPDMQLEATQQLSDGELFWIIENGIRFTGMPGWSTGTAEGEQSSWHLVHFVRHLPVIEQSEIDAIAEMTPRSPAEIRQEIEAERFLRGDDVTVPDVVAPHVH
jgi:mono/diheme cytochrome c family protein